MLSEIYKWLILVCLIVVFTLSCRKLFPPKHKHKSLEINLDELESKYKKWEIYHLLLYLTVFTPILVLFFYFVIAISIENYRFSNDALIVVGPDARSILFLPSFFLALIFAEPLSGFFIQKWLGKNDYNELQMLYECQLQIRNWKANRYFAMVMAPLAISLTFLLADTYIILKKDKIIISEYLSLREKHFEYNDITDSQILCDDKVKKNISPYYLLIKFKNGYVYDLRNDTAYKNLSDKQNQILALIEKRNRK